MSQNLQKTIQFTAIEETHSFPKTVAFFDWLHYVLKRTEKLLWQAKFLIFGTGFALFLIYELAHFAKYLFEKWNS